LKIAFLIKAIVVQGNIVCVKYWMKKLFRRLLFVFVSCSLLRPKVQAPSSLSLSPITDQDERFRLSLGLFADETRYSFYIIKSEGVHPTFTFCACCAHNSVRTPSKS